MKKFDKMLMGKRIQSSRIARKLTQKELADMLGMLQNNISNYESGRVVPPSNVLYELAEYFSVSADYLLGRDTTDTATILSRKNESLENAMVQIATIVQEEMYQKKAD